MLENIFAFTKDMKLNVPRLKSIHLKNTDQWWTGQVILSWLQGVLTLSKTAFGTSYCWQQQDMEDKPQPNEVCQLLHSHKITNLGNYLFPEFSCINQYVCICNLERIYWYVTERRALKKKAVKARPLWMQTAVNSLLQVSCFLLVHYSEWQLQKESSTFLPWSHLYPLALQHI